MAEVNAVSTTGADDLTDAALLERPARFRRKGGVHVLLNVIPHPQESAVEAPAPFAIGGKGVPAKIGDM
jgi:hypothetical protein